ncbi:MAG: histidinol dehydrogenase [Methanotrichaceae archaeon]|nr:histidinol dehydrogenase [Methanotrichaceae archaeon]
MILKKIEELGDEEIQGLLYRQVGIQDMLQSVDEIIKGVASRGDLALAQYTERFDGANLANFRVEDSEIDAAYDLVDGDLLDSLAFAAENIAAFHDEQREKDIWMTEIAPGITVGQKIVPIDSVGAYVPGGRATYPSSALMTVIPAKVADVPRVVVCTPPAPDGTIPPLTLVAADMAGADEIYKLGGVQAIAAMAFGTESIVPVEKIVGPGNAYVTAAKLLVRNTVEIDFPAGPSEVLIIADETAHPDVLAADMIAQLEHDPASISVLVTIDEALARAVAGEIDEQALSAERREIVEQGLQRSAILIASGLEDAVSFANDFAPEHLEIVVRDGMDLLKGIRHAGSIFIGPHTPVAAGDYASGTNHVLPTSGWARVFSGLNVDHFVKKITVQSLSPEGLDSLSETIISLSEAEGLPGHAESVRRRLEKLG